MDISSKNAITLENISKEYTTPNGNGKFFALKNINLEISRGDKIGISGMNGAGKTTLLKIISGITKPTTGKVTIKGKIVSLLDLGAGFDEELTGRENVMFNCMLHGMTKDEVKKNQSQIFSFAEIGNFIDAPFYTYSSGMKFRLAFAVTVSTKPDIILIDETFMSGDIDFQIKTLQKIESLSQNKELTLIMSSHYPLILRKCCKKFIFLNKGKISNNALDSITALSAKWNNFFTDIPLTKVEKKLVKNPFYQR
jgi:lipopolysaccharide transport system ATP-binding protein